VTRIRPIVLGCFVRGGRELLVVRGFDDHKGEEFFRFPGGGIEFGETGVEALHREMREELQEDIHIRRYLGFLENVFTYLGKPHHEIVQVYLAAFTNAAAYQCETMGVAENYPGQTNPVACWLPIEDFRSGRRILYPAGIIGMLDGLNIEAGAPSFAAKPLAAPVLLSQPVAESLLAACPEAGARKFLVDHLLDKAQSLNGACYEFTDADVNRYVVSPAISLAAGKDCYRETCHYHTIKTEIYLGGFEGFAIWQSGHPETAIVRRDFEGVVIIPPLWCHFMQPKPVLLWTMQFPNPVGTDKHEVQMPSAISAQMRVA